MNAHIATTLIQLLEAAEQQMLTEGTALFDASHLPLAERGPLLEQRRAFNNAAARWQHETQELIRVLREAPKDSRVVVSSPVPEPTDVDMMRDVEAFQPPPKLQQPQPPQQNRLQIEPSRTRLGLADSWQERPAVAYSLWETHMQYTNSTREMYRGALRLFSERYADEFIPRILAHKRVAPLALQKEPHTYTTPSISIRGYAFNVNLSAESLNAAMRFLYDAFAIDRGQFVMWVKD